MAKGLVRLSRLCALCLCCVGCSSNPGSNATGVGSTGAGGADGSAQTEGGESATSGAAGISRGGHAPAAGGTPASGAAAGSGSSGASGARPPASVQGKSVYSLECHGESEDCDSAAVPCLGVGSPDPDVAVGWACSNRCDSDADCSDAPSGGESQAHCVSFTSAGHCVLVCQNQSQSFSCPTGMTCYVPSRSPIGYCLWQ